MSSPSFSLYDLQSNSLPPFPHPIRTHPRDKWSGTFRTSQVEPCADLKTLNFRMGHSSKWLETLSRALLAIFVTTVALKKIEFKCYRAVFVGYVKNIYYKNHRRPYQSYIIINTVIFLTSIMLLILSLFNIVATFLRISQLDNMPTKSKYTY